MQFLSLLQCQDIAHFEQCMCQELNIVQFVSIEDYQDYIGQWYIDTNMSMQWFYYRLRQGQAVGLAVELVDLMKYMLDNFERFVMMTDNRFAGYVVALFNCIEVVGLYRFGLDFEWLTVVGNR